MGEKQKVFLGSSAEGERYAQALMALLPVSENNFEIIPWYHKEFFGISEFTLSTLERRAGEFAFGIFIMSSEDAATIRGKRVNITRDNVVFELGLFIGKLGIERCFFVTPKDVDYKLASDLSGLTSGRFKHDTGDDKGSLTDFADQVKTKIGQVQSQQFGNLSGMWTETWYAQGSGNFSIENTDETVFINHEGDNISADFKSASKTYRLKGKVRHNYVIGEWFDPNNSAGYKGAFQLKIALSGEAMTGIYTGNSETSTEVSSDKWVWKRSL